MNKKFLMIGGIGCGALVLLCICIAAVAFALGMGGTQAMADTGEAFMNALKTGNYNLAYSMCTPELQQKVGGVQGLQKMVEGGSARPSQWSFSSRNVSGNEGTLDGTVTMTGGQGVVSLTLIQDGGAWKIVGFNLKAQ